MREAELFALVEPMLVEVFGRVSDADLDIMVPPLSDLPDAPAEIPIAAVVEQYAYDAAGVPSVLMGGAADVLDRAELGRRLVADRQATLAQVSTAAVRAACAVKDPDVVVHPRYGALSMRDYLLRLTVNRSLVAHYVAAYLGSTACPLPEDLARPLWELTKDDAASWRALGIFGEPTEIPPLSSWRDTFLRTAGHAPHPNPAADPH